IVARRKWMDDKAFINLVGATNLIPGPNSTELAIHLGKERAGWKGLLTAGFFFIMPALLITGVIAWLYKSYGALPEVKPFVYGIRPAIIAVIIVAVFPLAKASVKTIALCFTGIASLVLVLLGTSEIVIIFGAGLLFLLYDYLKAGKAANSFFPLLLFGPCQTISNTGLFFTFLKIGAILYGSGYVLFAFIDTELVATGILSRQQLMDAVAVGQFTPGPVFSSVTFIGYQVNGLSGAIAATAGVFLPSFIFVALLNVILHKVNSNKLFTSFLNAVNVASVAVIAAVCWHMGKESITGWETFLIGTVSLLVLIVFPRLNSAFIVLFGSISGYLLTLI
ncbi:MAG TPA: chromate efflux transporter, partial [Flavobacterium sp.]|nr:chromate efflux transporter [Flavobacterium sp.]